jgi:hypothetical protein
MYAAGSDAPWIALYGAVVKEWSASYAIAIMCGMRGEGAHRSYGHQVFGRQPDRPWAFIRDLAAEKGTVTLDDLAARIGRDRAAKNLSSMVQHGALRIVNFRPPRVYALP